VRLYIDGLLAKQALNFAGSVLFTVGPLSDGPHQFVADAVDTAGNVRPKSGTLALTIDTKPPTLPTLDLDPAPDTLPVGDGATNLQIVTLDGKTDANLTVTLRRASDVNTPIATTTSDNSGNFSFAGVALASGPNGFRVVAQTSAGNISQLDLTFTTTA